MSGVRRTWQRLRALLAHRQADRELEEEMASHLALAAEEHQEQGLSPEEARRRAGVAFGGVERVRGEHRDARGFPWLDALARDLRFAFRGLRRDWAFAAVAIVILGLGIGANTAIFTVVDAVLLRPLPLPHPERVVSILEHSKNFPATTVSWPDYIDWQRDNRSFSALGLARYVQATLTRAGTPATLRGVDATASFFTALGTAPELGRTYTTPEDRVGAGPVVVIADSLWRERFGADPAILGKAIELNGNSYTVIGVMPPQFSRFWGNAYGPTGPQFFLPAGPLVTADSNLAKRGNHSGFGAFGRLKPGVSPAQAEADMTSIAARLAARHPETNTGVGINFEPLRERLVGDTRSALWMMLLAVGLVLLIACANLANLLIARAATRARDGAIRTALGASRWSLIRGQLAESLCLGAGGAAVGWGIGWLCLQAAPAILPHGIPRAGRLDMNATVLAFAVGAALVTALLSGLAPAFLRGRPAARSRLSEVLKEGGRDTSSHTHGQQLRSVLVAVEMSLALVLLAGAGLLIRSLIALDQAPLGFAPDHTLSFSVSLPALRYPTLDREVAFFHGTQQRLAALPGVSAVGAVTPLPFGQGDWEDNFQIAGRPQPAPGHAPVADVGIIAGDGFRALGIPLLSGRFFNTSDTATSIPVIIVDSSFARKYFPGPDPAAAALGRLVENNGKEWQIVGVVSHIRYHGLEETPRVEMYRPMSQAGQSLFGVAYVLRTRTADPMQLQEAAAAVIRSQDPDLPLDDVATMQQRVSGSLAQRRLGLWLMGAFALLALTLAAVGIYGVLAYAVEQRRQEIGVRMALGASRGRVVRMILGQGLRLAAAGAVCGLVVAILAGKWASAYLYNTSAADPLTLAGVALLLLAIAAVACFVPAWRAARVSPVEALREN